jgi:hypothetical protein
MALVLRRLGGRERRTPVALGAGPRRVPPSRAARRERAARRPPAAPRPVVSAAAALLVAALAVAGVLLTGPAQRVLPPPAARAGEAAVPAAATAQSVASAGLPAGGAAAEPARVAALRELLDARAAALLARDRDGWLEPLAGGGAAEEYAARQAAVFEHLGAVPLAAWRWEYAGPGDVLGLERAALLGAAPPADDAGAPVVAEEPWVAHVVLVYRLRDGGGEVRREQYLTLLPDPSAPAGWRIASDRDGPTAVDLWDLGPVAVARGERSVVVGTGDVASYVAVTDEAARRVDRVWGEDWPRTSLVEVPATQAEFARLLGREGEVGLGQIAAVTTGETAGGEVATTGDRVVVNPQGFAGLGELGRRVVMTHELTHVATRATTSAPVPIWLGEGYADWVAYQGSGLARRTVAEPLLAAVRAGTAPAELATLDDFDPTRGEVAQAYAGSWLAVDMLAREHGDAAVTAFYRAVASAGPVEADLARARPGLSVQEEGAARLDAALRAHFGTDGAGLTAAWRQHLAQLARGEAAEPPPAARPAAPAPAQPPAGAAAPR